MIGSNLSRFNLDQKYLLFDIESNGVNLYYSFPWEFSYAVATLRSGIISTKTVMLKWNNFSIDPDLARKVHFDRQRYEAEAKPVEDAWSGFAPLLFNPEYRVMGHGIINFDIFMIAVIQRFLGVSQPNQSYIYHPCVDTDALGRAYKKQFTPDISSPEAFVRFQYQCLSHIEKGLKTSLGAMCAEFGVAYDERAAHASSYDTNVNWLLFKEMVKRIEF